MSNVTIFSFAEYAVEESRRAEQVNMSTMQWGEWPPSYAPLLGQEYTAGLAVRCSVEQQILDLI